MCSWGLGGGDWVPGRAWGVDCARPLQGTGCLISFHDIPLRVRPTRPGQIAFDDFIQGCIVLQVPAIGRPGGGAVGAAEAPLGQ